VTVVILLALGVGVGIAGVVSGIRSQRTTLQRVLSGLVVESTGVSGQDRLEQRRAPKRLDRRIAVAAANEVRERKYFEREVGIRLALSNSTLEDLIARCLVCAAIGCFLPALAWIPLVAERLRVPALVLVGAGALLGVGGALLPIAELNAASKRGRRHARRVICSFLDLVVLGLAGGMGIESALLAAAQLGENVVSRRMVSALSLCRDTGEPPWTALARLGETLGIEELGELAATAGLAGLEGAKVRATLAARSSSIRRHELANAEAEANALTERLFIPGAFLLVGFLIFIGYPAFTRIASGF
jgi:Flp pilus assembly protein TadB